MRVLLALALAVAAPAAAQAPTPATPGAEPPPVVVPERKPDVGPATPKPDLTPKLPNADEPSRPDVRTVAGQIGGVARPEHRFTLEAADGPVDVAVDRNTLVFLESRLGTVSDLHSGLPVRVGLEGPRNLATWVEVRPQGTAPASSKQEPVGVAPAPTGGTAAGSGSKGRPPPTPSPIPPTSTPPGPAGPGSVPGGGGVR